MVAQRAAEGQHEPAQRALDAVPHADASEVDGPAMGAVVGDHAVFALLASRAAVSA